MQGALPTIAVVLPPREGFGPGRTGAVGLLARCHLQIPGFQTTVFGGRQDGPVFPDADFRPVTPALWPPGSINARYSAALAGLFRKRPPALIEVHNRPEIALGLATRLSDVPVTLILNNDPQGMVNATTSADRTEILRRLARVITASNYLLQRVLDGIPSPPRLPCVVHNCLDLSELPPIRQPEKLILFAGRVVPEKAPDAFVAACAAALPFLPDWTAEIIGADRFSTDSPDTAFVQTVRAAADAAGVKMLGYRDHPEVLAAMARAAIVVVPSRWQEPFGLVALEALASGAVLICSPRGGLPEVGGDAAVYVNPDDPADIAAALKNLGHDHAKRAALSVAGRQRAKLFDITMISPQLGALRREVLGESGALIACRSGNDETSR